MTKCSHFRKVVYGMFTAACVMIMGVACGINVLAAGESVTASISSGNVNVNFKSTQAPASDDGKIYLFAETYATAGITTEPVATANNGTSAQFSVPLKKNEADSKLYSRFVVGTKSGGKYVPLNTGAYITNPEACATKAVPRVNTGKKGLLVDSAKINDGRELTDLGIKQAIYNIPVNNILGQTTHPAYPTINYTYQGKTYQFNGQVITEYDNIFYRLSKKNIAITATLLCNMGNNKAIIHPKALDGGRSNYYMFNTATAEGCQTLEAVGTFLAKRYGGTGVGSIDNWVIGNEVNAYKEWNYFGRSPQFGQYCEAYEKSVRLFYNAIKSENSNARIYLCLDQNWNSGNPVFYNGKDLLTQFDADFIAGGNIDWGLAFHPYNTPLQAPAFWLQGAEDRAKAVHSMDTAMITMENLDVLTDFMCNPLMLAPNGQVRSIILSEQGYTSSKGEALQAASIVHAYLVCENNQHIDAFLLSRESDDSSEVSQGLALGLSRPGGAHKMAYEYYKHIDGPNASKYIQAASATIGTNVVGLITKR